MTQIGYATVFFWEYFGPLALYAAVYFLPQLAHPHIRYLMASLRPQEITVPSAVLLTIEGSLALQQPPALLPAHTSWLAMLPLNSHHLLHMSNAAKQIAGYI